MAKKKTAVVPAEPKPRNSVSRNPLLRKSHAHTVSKKTERAAARKALRDELDKNR